MALATARIRFVVSGNEWPLCGLKRGSGTLKAPSFTYRLQQQQLLPIPLQSLLFQKRNFSFCFNRWQEKFPLSSSSSFLMSSMTFSVAFEEKLIDRPSAAFCSAGQRFPLK
ncbi:hypothetical protein AVEN_154577-1 [Araneus ventricosus]|uniref:Uncharacterized protein n=1 Tax=Araneus ventricosus TaxID=182803 RepID=A0A4Y2FUD6_ARAVE|nr:hypothetical protein AVEN_154577-1 [Araneus ventricosus]